MYVVGGASDFKANMRVMGLPNAITCNNYSLYSKNHPLNQRSFHGTKLNRLQISWRPMASPARFTRILALSTNDIKVGTNIEVDGAPWRVMEFLHVKPGKGAAFVRTKLRNYVTSNTVEKTFRAGASVDEADIMKETKQYTYKDGGQFVFMDMSTYEESRLDESDLGDNKMWLKEGLECSVLSWNGRVIDVEFPVSITYKVVEAEIGVKGDTVQGGSKPVTIDTGAVVYVPFFVNVGDDIVVDTRTGSYMSRA